MEGFTEYDISFLPLYPPRSISISLYFFASFSFFCPFFCLFSSFSFFLSFFLTCSLLDSFSFSECSEWKVTLALCVCVCFWVFAHASVHLCERAELLKWDWSTGSCWGGGERSAEFNSYQFGPLPLTSTDRLAKCLRQTACFSQRRVESSARSLS